MSSGYAPYNIHLDRVASALEELVLEIVKLNDRIEDAVLGGLVVRQETVSSQSSIKRPWAVDVLQ